MNPCGTLEFIIYNVGDFEREGEVALETNSNDVTIVVNFELMTCAVALRIFPCLASTLITLVARRGGS